jgi:hypothetical protein
MKDRIEEKDKEKQSIRGEAEKYRMQIDKINQILGTRSISDIEEWSFLEHSNLTKYL